MTTTPGLPSQFQDMAEAYDAYAVRTGDIDVTSFFLPVPDRMGTISQTVRASVQEMCELSMGYRTAPPKVVGNFIVASGEAVVDESAIHIYREHQAKHAYEGTLILSLIERISRKTTLGIFGSLKEKVRRNRRVDPITWELIRHFGRPSVPREILPVFAVYEAEKRLGHPIERLTETQMRAIGL